MTRRKKASKRTPSSRRTSARRNSFTANVRRFLKGLTGAAIASFSIASFVLNPQWRADIDLSPWLGEWVLPQHQPVPPLVQVSGEYAQTRFAECRRFFPAAGTPVVPAAPALRELCFTSFAVLHSGSTKTPVFVAQRLNRSLLEQARGIERTDRFYAEARLPSAERAELADYRGSGYSRGHMAPAADMPNAEAMAQSFSLANMVPQDSSQNSGPWNRIEQDTRKYIRRTPNEVYVFTGPVFGDRLKTIGEGRVAVPDALFKVVHDAGTGRTWVHWQQNSPDAVAGRPISYAEFVKRTGLYLLP